MLKISRARLQRASREVRFVAGASHLATLAHLNLSFPLGSCKGAKWLQIPQETKTEAPVAGAVVVVAPDRRSADLPETRKNYKNN